MNAKTRTPLECEVEWDKYTHSDGLEFAKALELERNELRAWKESQMAVESQWDVQKIGKLIGAQMGQPIRHLIQPFIERSLFEIEQARNSAAWWRNQWLKCNRMMGLQSIKFPWE